MKDNNNNSDGFFPKIGKGDKSKEVYFGIDFRNNLEKDTKPNKKPIVTWVDQNGPSKNKIFKDDIILSVNGNIVKNVKDFFLERSKLKPGDKSSLVIKRSKKKITHTINLISLKQHYKNIREEVIFNIEMKDLSGNHKCQDCGSFFHQNPLKKPIITFVRKGGITDSYFEIGDLICSINEKKIKNIIEFEEVVDKLKWNSKVNFKINRNGKIINKSINLPEYKDQMLDVMVPNIDVELNKKKQITIRGIYRDIGKSGFENVTNLKPKDIILTFNSKKINFIQDWFIELSKISIGEEIKLKIKRGKTILDTAFKTFSLNEFINRFKKSLRYYFGNNEKKLDIFLNEWDEINYGSCDTDRIEEIRSMDLGELDDDNKKISINSENPEEYNYVDKEYKYEAPKDEEIKIKTLVNKKKINGKDSFVISLKNLPDDSVIEQYNDEDKKIYLKIYLFDITELDKDKYYESVDNEQYYINNCHVIKTDDFTWSEGDKVLVQAKELKPYEEISDKLAIPYSVMLFPKFGKRKISFRTFICTNKQKFDNETGRLILNEKQSFAAEEFFLLNDNEEFDENKDFPEVLSYHNTEVEAQYKQPGYLEANKRKLNDLQIALGFCFSTDNPNNIKNTFEKIKKEIEYVDFSSEGNIYKILNLKKNYEKALNGKINLDEILKELKRNSIIHERYEIIDFLLNLAIDDKTFNEKENNFIDLVSNNLDLNSQKYQEIKKQKTASVKFVDFGKQAGESIFGITKDMSIEEKEKTLRKEYSRWNALTNNSDKSIRERSREMRDLAAKLRSDLNN